MRIDKRRIFQITVFVLFAAHCCGCGESTLCESYEVKRITSPDGLVDAAVINKNCGATTSMATEVYLLPSGEKAGNKGRILLADKTDGLNVFWKSNKLLHIVYGHARIFEYTNFWQSKELDNFQYVVEVKEYKG